jgi:hypothetical protein
MLVARWLWRELGLENILDGLVPKTNRVQKADRLPFADRVLVLVANRLCRPGSEHALAQWLESDFVCGRDGKRILAPWKQQGRVRVDLNWLQEWYRTLDQLLAGKERIEVELFARLRDLFHLQVEMVFYDLTSTYFEGRGPAGLANFGYSRDGKPRNRQVQVGLVMINGWPIAHHVFDGSLRDSATVEMVLKDLQERFGLGRVIFVGDRGDGDNPEPGFAAAAGTGLPRWAQTAAQRAGQSLHPSGCTGSLAGVSGRDHRAGKRKGAPHDGDGGSRRGAGRARFCCPERRAAGL